jgi:hypothetical protein
MKILQCSHITATVDSGGERKEEGGRRERWSRRCL